MIISARMICGSLMMILCLAGCQHEPPAQPHNIDGWGDMPCTDPNAPRQLYCYRSLGQIECFQEPQRDREEQLVNYYTAHAPAKIIPSRAYTYLQDWITPPAGDEGYSDRFERQTLSLDNAGRISGESSGYLNEVVKYS